MPLRITVLDACAGNHAKVDVTLNGEPFSLRIWKPDVLADPTREDLEHALQVLLAVLAKSNNLNTWAKVLTFFSNRLIY